MAWSLSYKEIRNPELVDALLLTAGKALYLANAFEGKCKYVLRIFNLVQSLEDDPVLSLEQAIAALPKDKMLGGTLQDILLRRIDGDAATPDLLDSARKARNLIAHEGIGAGAIWNLSVKDIIERSELLRGAVSDLAAGDNVVSTWCYEIDEKEPAPQAFKANYPDMVDHWIFGQLDDLLSSIDPPTTDRPHYGRSSDR